MALEGDDEVRLFPHGRTFPSSRAPRLGQVFRGLLVWAVVSVLLASCVPGSQFRPTDLSRITLGPSETPLGLRYDPEASGFKSREEMIQRIKQTAKLGPKQVEKVATEGGIEAGHIAWFFPGKVVSGEAELRPPMPVLEVVLTLYENELVAIREFGGVGKDLPENFYPVRLISVTGLGNQSFAVADEPNKRSGFWYLAWRRRNLMVQLHAEGMLERATILDLAEEIDLRAAALE